FELDHAGAVAGAAGEADVLDALEHIEHGARPLAAGAEQVHLQGQRVLVRLAGQDIFQRSIGDDAAVPVPLAIDLHGGERRRQRAGGEDVLDPDGVAPAVEVAEVAAGDAGGTDRQADAAVVVDAVEVDEPL